MFGLVAYLYRQSKRLALLSVLLAILSGVAGAAALAWFNRALSQPLFERDILMFCGLCVAILVTSALSPALLASLSQRALEQLRYDLCLKILATPLRQIEQLGQGRLLANLVQDVNAVSDATLHIPFIIANGVLVAGCLAYVGFVAPKALLFMAGVILVGYLTYLAPSRLALRRSEKAREVQDEIMRLLRGLIDGNRELKLNLRRQGAYRERQLRPAIADFRRHSIAARVFLGVAQGWGWVLFYFVIGFCIWFLGGGNVQSREVTLVVLYMMGPIESLVMVIPQMQQSSVALSRLSQLGFSLKEELAARAPRTQPSVFATWSSLQLKSVTFAYHESGRPEDATFGAGPFDLSLRPGEIVFVVGGNGSGKSTLGKLITGLYPPTSGQIFCNDQLVTPDNIDDYRQNFSVIFADFFLFDRLLGIDAKQIAEKAHPYLERLELSHKVDIHGDVFSATALSTGQRKRLALLVEYLEDRPIYLFDEWAADQDPEFREFFYTELLPDLKTRGKAIIAITHDDRYFHLADTVIKLERGKIVAKAEGSSGEARRFSDLTRPGFRATPL